MSKAEERALKAYPVVMTTLIPADNEHPLIEQDCNKFKRVAYIEGYHQAKKDRTLTIEDIEEIDNLLWNLSSEWSGKNDNAGYFQEVLNRFNKQKEK